MNNKVSFLIGIFISLLSVQSYACSVTYYSSSDPIKRTMKVGFDRNNGWNFNKYDPVCNILEKNNAGIHLSGDIWEHEKDQYVAFYIMSVFDKSTGLVSTDFGRNGTILRSNYSDPSRIYIDLFDEINNSIDTWHAEGSLDSAIKSFHESKLKMRGK